MPKFKRSQAKYVKKPHKIKNWAEYNKSLERRGSLTLWISDEAISSWKSKKVGKPGGQEIYSDLAIELGLTLKITQKSAWRQTRAFIKSLFELIKVDLEVPCYSTFSRRCRKLGAISIVPKKQLKGPLNISIDSSGVSVHNGKKKRPTKNRSWRKFHIAVDERGVIVASEISSSNATDSSKVKKLLKQIDRPVSAVRADSGYDNNNVYNEVSDYLKNKGSKIIIPPKKNAVVSKKSHPQRNRSIRSRIRFGKRPWIKMTRYNQRNRVENAFFRYKKIIGSSLSARTLKGQRVEQQMGCKISNTLTNLGMPQSSLKK